MGMFSWECLACGHSILGPYSLTKQNSWMNRAVCIDQDGNIHTGDYDGYGRVGVAEVGFLEPKSMWHRSCWELVGKPGYNDPSPSARDQGHFIVPEDYEHDDPLVTGKLPERHAIKHAILRLADKVDVVDDVEVKAVNKASPPKERT